MSKLSVLILSSAAALLLTLTILSLFSSSSSSSTTTMFVEAVDENTGEKVVDLTDDNYEEAIAKNPLVFILAYAPWCPHSKKIMVPFQQASIGDGKQVLYGRIDATTNKNFARKFNIKAFPTLKFFRNGKFTSDYDGGRSEADLAAYSTAMRNAAVRTFLNTRMFQDYRDKARWAFVVCMDTIQSDTCSKLEEVADSVRGQDIHFFALTDLKIAKEAGLEKYEKKWILQRPNDEPRIHEIADVPLRDTATLRHEIEMQSLPLFGPLAPDSYKTYISVKLPMLYLFLSDVSLNKPADKTSFNAVRQAAPEFKGKITFAYIDGNKYSSMAPRVGLSGDKFPAIAIDQAGSFYTFPADQDISVATVSSFARAYLSNGLKRTVRSEIAPAGGQHTSVDGLTTVVGSTFEELIEKADTDVFLLMSAPWCSHSKAMAPSFLQLAKKMKDEDVRIAKFDATANDYDKTKYQVVGFPTIFWIKKGSPPEEYTAGRSLEDMLTFVRDKVE